MTARMACHSCHSFQDRNFYLEKVCLSLVSVHVPGIRLVPKASVFLPALGVTAAPPRCSLRVEVRGQCFWEQPRASSWLIKPVPSEHAPVPGTGVMTPSAAVLCLGKIGWAEPFPHWGAVLAFVLFLETCTQCQRVVRDQKREMLLSLW